MRMEADHNLRKKMKDSLNIRNPKDRVYVGDLQLGDIVYHHKNGFGKVTFVSMTTIKIHYVKKQFYHVYNKSERVMVEWITNVTHNATYDIAMNLLSPDKEKLTKVVDRVMKDNESAKQKLPDNKWDKRFFELAAHYASWSKDPSTQCGAVIAHGKKQISQGYNGFPENTSDDITILNNRDRKYARVLHAELNAILTARRDLTGCTIYVYPFFPCSQCMAAIIQSGISKVVTRMPSGDLKTRWETSNTEAQNMAKEAGVEIVLLHED